MLLPKRVWKDIPGYEGKYQVSNIGQVRSLNYRGNTGKTKILKQDTGRDGYKRVVLCKDGKYKKYLVHRLVAMAFIPNPHNYPIINQKDENKTNNQYKNLEWCTIQYNNNYGTHNEKISKTMKGKNTGKNNPFYGKQHTEETKKKISTAKKGKKRKGKPILMFTKEDEFIRRFNSVADANEFLGKSRYNANIYLCAEGTNEIAYGYKWEYEE